MILLRSEILKELDAGNICISPFVERNLGPNSYDCTLQSTLVVYDCDVIDMAMENPTRTITIPESGYRLVPGELYIGATNECASSKKFVPCLEGRSSVARLGISVHDCGFGDVGFSFNDKGESTFATWTLEITVARPVIIYPNRRVCQVFFFNTLGDLSNDGMYRGKYSYQKLPQPSHMFKDHEH